MMLFKNIVFALLFILIQFSCSKVNRQSLDEYSVGFPLSDKWLIACAAGNEDGFDGDDKNTISIFFYPQDGASDFKYFKTKNLDAASTNFSNYKEVKGIESEDVFNGYLKKFRLNLNKEHWGIVTYRVGDSIRISDPIKVLHKSRKTETEQNLLSITEDGITPQFSWLDGQFAENVIYFQVITDMAGDLVSGTYTIDKQFTFYDTTNVVINITENPLPTLNIGEEYNFTLMGVSDDNWVNIALNKDFITN